MITEVLNRGMFDSNSYVLIDGKDAVVIDAGVDAKAIIEKIKLHGAMLKYILLTHNHIDHICSVNDLKEQTGAKICIHSDDSDGLTKAEVNLSTTFAHPMVFDAADIILRGGEKLEFGNEIIEILHTPGHSKGGVCFRVQGNVFTGDTLFRSSVGRTDFVGGDHDLLISGIRTKLLVLDEETVVYPGHGPSSTIGREKRNNGFLV